MKKLKIPAAIFIATLLCICFSYFGTAQERLSPKGITKTTPRPQAAAQDTKPQEKPLVPQGKEADITIFFTGDVIGNVEECG